LKLIFERFDPFQEIQIKVACGRWRINFPDLPIRIAGKEVCGMDCTRTINTVGIQGDDHIQSEESEICQILP
jgi:hypothetical protein